MKIWTALVHTFLMVFSREYREKRICEKQTKFCVDNIVVMHSKDDNPRDVIVRWVEKYIQLHYVDRRVVAKCLLDQRNLYLTELAVKLDSALRLKAIEQILDAANAMCVNDDAIGSYSSITAIDFVASAYQLVAQDDNILNSGLIVRMQSIISRAAYIALHLMFEDYPQMLYLKIKGFYFCFE